MTGAALQNAPARDGRRAGAVRHLYVHLPFCAHRCGYCDFVTVVGRSGTHGAYVDALIAELTLRRPLLAPEIDTVFVGGGTPTFTDLEALDRLLGALPGAGEVTVEANPETVSDEIVALLRSHRVTRVSLGVQSFQEQLLAVLERRAGPDVVRRAFYALRDAGFDNISLDLLYGIPGQSPADLERDLEEALALAPEHVSCYELEAKPGTRFTHTHGDELARQREAMEGYFEHVVDTLTAAGYRWYETSNFCLTPERAEGRDLRSRHNLAYWLGRDYVGLGIGAVSTAFQRRWRNAPKLAAYIAALTRGEDPPHDVEPLSPAVRAEERLMLGLRLDEPVPMTDVAAALDERALARMEHAGMVERKREALRLTRRGRFIGGAVTVELLAS
jgi:oxygen-independent coproporphyrinogen-3 oxidase